MTQRVPRNQRGWHPRKANKRNQKDSYKRQTGEFRYKRSERLDVTRKRLNDEDGMAS